MNLDTYIPSLAELSLAEEARKQNDAVHFVYEKYLENMLARVHRLADQYDRQAKKLIDAGAPDAGALISQVASQVREAASPMPDTKTPQPRLRQEDRKKLKRRAPPHGRRR